MQFQTVFCYIHIVEILQFEHFEQNMSVPRIIPYITCQCHVSYPISHVSATYHTLYHMSVRRTIPYITCQYHVSYPISHVSATYYTLYHMSVPRIIPMSYWNVLTLRSILYNRVHLNLL